MLRTTTCRDSELFWLKKRFVFDHVGLKRASFAKKWYYFRGKVFHSVIYRVLEMIHFCLQQEEGLINFYLFSFTKYEQQLNKNKREQLIARGSLQQRLVTVVP